MQKALIYVFLYIGECSLHKLVQDSDSPMWSLHESSAHELAGLDDATFHEPVSFWSQ